MTPKPDQSLEDPVRPHTYDGIQEYDKRLPNWWLMTLYASIAFAAAYWGYYEWFRIGLTGPQHVEQAINQIEAAKLASAPAIDNASLWKMSRNPLFVDAGKATFDSTCAACHFASLRGKSENPAAIGPDLTDTKWINGGTPVQIYDTITKGVLAKGMPTWGPVLGSKKISESVAYILSKHTENEPVEIDPAAAPPQK